MDANSKLYWLYSPLRFIKPILLYEKISLIKNKSINEDSTNTSSPRFTLMHKDVFTDMPANKPIPYSDNIMKKCIEYGMVITISYKGDKDNWNGGRERTIYPMVLGKSSEGKILLRGWQLNGWSVSKKGNTEKEWRLFRCDRMKSITFTGTFFRLPPEGYVSQDSIMKGGIISAANLDSIKKKQLALTYSGKVDDEDKVIITGNIGVKTIKIENTNSILNLTNTITNPIIKNLLNKADKDKLRIIIVKSNNSKTLAIIGVLGEVGKSLKIYEKNKLLGTYQVKYSGDFSSLPKIIEGKSEYDLYTLIS